MPDASNGAGRALVSVVVPVYNEAATVGQVVDELLELDLRLEVLLVDDGSTDDSPLELARLAERHGQVKVLTQPQNRGKGAAVRRGITESTGDILLIQDADLEYSPSDIPALIDPLLSGKADAVFGTRLRGGAHPQRAHLFWHYAGNRFLTLLANVLYNTTISDMEVGYKAFRGDLVRGLDLISDDFRIEPELTAKVLRLGPGIRLYEVPISYYGRSYAEGKKITWRDGFGAVGALAALPLLLGVRRHDYDGFRRAPPAAAGWRPPPPDHQYDRGDRHGQRRPVIWPAIRRPRADERFTGGSTRRSR